MASDNTSRSPRGSAQRPAQRFLTGILLGVILALTLGLFTPLMAQNPAPAPDADTRTRVTPAAEPSPETEPGPAVEALPDADSEVSPTLEEPPGAGSDFEASPDPLLEELLEAPPPPIIPVDIGDHWADACLRGLAERRALTVDEAQRFYPNQPATWADVTALMNRVLPTSLTAYAGASAVEAALHIPTAINVLFNYPPHFYDPSRSITRAEAVTALAAKLELPYVARARDLLTASLRDGARVADYGQEGVAAALEAGVLINYPDAQQLNPNQPITRGELGALLCQASGEADLQRHIVGDWIAQPQPLPAQIMPNRELRGVWLTNVDSNVLFSRENLETAIARLKALNINTLYPVVWNGGFTLYPSRVGERILGKAKQLYPDDNPEFEAAQGDRDMLQELIEIAHAEGMAVIPWFEFGFMAPADYTLRRQHPEWFTQRQDGTDIILKGEEAFSWLNPIHPRVQQLLLLLMEEVLTNYEVEGIQVDDHLGMPVDMGYDPYTVHRYRQEHDSEDPPTDENDPEWVRWRAAQISQFIDNVHRLVELRRPEAIVSVSPNPYPFSYVRYLQDWPSWVEAGYVDELVVQVYRSDLDRFIWELNKTATKAARRRIDTSIGLLSGLRGRPMDGAMLQTQLQAVRDRAYAGVSYFFYETLWVPGQETLEERQQQLKSGFTEPAVRP